MQKKFDTLLKTREFLVNTIASLSNEQLNKIPTGFKNNIAWNVAHLLVSQQILCYKLAGLDSLVSNELIENFRKGSIPNFTVSNEEFATIKKQFLEMPIQLSKDYEKEIFKNYTEYTTSMNVILTNIDDAIDYNLYHEGIHIGVVLQLLKFI